MIGNAKGVPTLLATRRAVVVTGTRLAYSTPLVVATASFVPLQRASAASLISGDAEAIAAAQSAGEPPVAAAGKNIRVTDDNGDGVEAVTLDGSASTDPDGTIVSFEWTIGDRTVSKAIATFDLPVGKHTAVLTVTDNDGLKGTDKLRIVVAVAAEEPTPVPQPPRTPDTLAAKMRRDDVSLTWKDRSDDENGFRVYRSLDGGSSWSPIGEVAAGKRSLRDGDVEPGATYGYAVASFNDAGESDWSEAAWITVEGAAPAATDAESETSRQEEAAPPPVARPATPKQVKLSEKDSEVELRWRHDADNTVGFRIYRSDDDGRTFSPIGEVPPDKKRYLDRDVEPGATYIYLVVAFNDAGESDPSSVESITLEAPPPEEPAVEEQEAPVEEPPADDPPPDDPPKEEPPPEEPPEEQPPEEEPPEEEPPTEEAPAAEEDGDSE
jgi:hypothetical protein